MRKKKIKLNAYQKKIFKHLEWFIANEIVWIGEQDLREAVLDGHIAVFSISGDPEVIYRVSPSSNCFDTLVMDEDRKGAEAIMRWNPSTHSMAVDLNWFYVMAEQRRPFSPDFRIPKDL